MKINYSFKLLIALFSLANLGIEGAAGDESGFSPAVEQLDLSFLDRYCKACYLFFKDNDSFKEHLSNHEFPIQAEEVDDDEDEDLKRRFKCGQCGKSFTQNCDLRRHQRIHTGEKPFKCTKCKRSFTQSGDLKKHERIHTGEKPYKCDQCGQYFSDNCNFKRHQKFHTGKKPYQCTKCEQSFTQNCDLRRHQKVHAKQASQV